MIDIKLLRENKKPFVESQKKRGQSTAVLDEILDLDSQWKGACAERDELKHTRNTVSMEVAKIKKSGQDAAKLIQKMQDITEKIKFKEVESEDLQKKRDNLLTLVPNLLHESVPKGATGDENVEVSHSGKILKFDFKPKDHIELCTALELFDLERGAKAAGARFYYLKNDLVRLDLAVAQYALDSLAKKGFTPLMVPHMVNEKAMFGCAMLPASREEIYKIENQDLYLILTSEHAICGMHMDETFESKDLPIRYAGYSPCYRTEAGAHGRDTKGIVRVHQFNKVEMFVFSHPDNSWKEHESLRKTAEELVKGLELPYRVVNICTGDIGTVAAKKYDLEVWLPGQNQYRELISCSNCTDYQARRSNTRFVEKTGDKSQFVHTLNSTALAIGRTCVAIIENFQQKDGSIKIPKALQPYMGGQKVIKKSLH